MLPPDDRDLLDVIDSYAELCLKNDPDNEDLMIIRHLVEALASDATRREQCVKEAAELAANSNQGWQEYWDDGDETW